MKNFLIPITLLVIVTTLHGQDSRISLGFEITPVLTTLRGNLMTDTYDPKPGIAAGITFDYVFSDHISFKTGISYERKGAIEKTVLTTINGSQMGENLLKINYDYMTFPVLVSYSTKGKVRFYVRAGTFFGFLLSQKNLSDEERIIPGGELDNTEDSKKIDFGLATGAGISISLGEKTALELGFRNNLGLINTSKLEMTDDGTIKTNSFGMNIGIKRLL